MIRMLLTVVLLVAVALVALILGTIAKNGVSLGDAPGFVERVRTFTSTNVAETRPDHAFPELRTRSLAGSGTAEAISAAEKALRDLGYGDVTVDVRSDMVSGVAVTAMAKFKDDVTLTFRPAGSGVSVNVRSQSRVGKGDFGANVAHVTEVYEALGAKP